MVKKEIVFFSHIFSSKPVNICITTAMQRLSGTNNSFILPANFIHHLF